MRQVHLCQARMFSTVPEKQILRDFEFHPANTNPPAKLHNVLVAQKQISEQDALKRVEMARNIKPVPVHKILSPLKVPPKRKQTVMKKLRGALSVTGWAFFCLSPFLILYLLKPLLIG